LFLAASESAFLRRQAQRQPFVRRAVSRFMPGEHLDDALAASQQLAADRLSVILTHLGENVKDVAEANVVVEHYLEVIRRLRGAGLDAEVSVKLTQLGLDLGTTVATGNLARIAQCMKTLPASRLWIDMESSPYVDRTFDVFRAVRADYPRLGVCVQAYLHRTAGDVEALAAAGAAVRVVKGAYKEPASVAMPKKADVDESFYRLSVRLLAEDARRAGAWLAAGTHDTALISRIAAHADGSGVARDRYEFALLYGIQRAEQQRLAAAGYRCRVLVSYGTYWFPWYMRRLAERPANVLFVLRGILGG
jgi:proline dehydrogenase